MENKNLTKKIFFSLSFIITFVIYLKTTAPTIVFWDVGEFLATSWILGIPHPPGTPFYVIVGRFFSLLPIPFLNVVQKITLAAILSGAFSAGIGYLLLYKIFNRVSKKLPDILKHFSAFMGSLCAPFTFTTWWSGIEAETYVPSTLFITLSVYLLFLWWEKKDKNDSLRYIITAFYLLSLSSGIHLLSLIIIPVLLIFIAVIKKEEIFNIEFLSSIGIFLLLAGALRATYEPFSLKALLLFIITGSLFSYTSIWKKHNKKFLFNSFEIIYFILFILSLVSIFQQWKILIFVSTIFLLLITFIYTKLFLDARGFALIFIIIGVTPEFYLLIRSRFDTPINQVEPKTWQSFWDVLSRKQYEPMNIYPRRTSNVRQGEFFSTPVYNQFWSFIDQIWGFFYYFSWQFIPLIVILGIIGIISHIYSDWKSFVLFGGAFIIGTLGLIVQLNLNYPSTLIDFLNFIKQFPKFLYSQRIREVLSIFDLNNPSFLQLLNSIPTEVRDRDYFFIPGYFFFGLYAGFGLFEIIRLSFENLKEKFSVYLKYIFIIFSIFIPIWQISAFYHKVDRSKNYIAEDYSYNLLSCVDDGGIVFTNGDNDTFPLWALQILFGYKKSVIVANLSLLNTDWYNIQLKRWGVPIHFTEDEIKKLIPFRTEKDIVLVRDIMIRDIIAGVFGYEFNENTKTRTLPTGVSIPEIFLWDGREFMKEVIEKGKNKLPKPPLFFSMTCERKSYRDFQDYLLLEGMVYRVTPFKQEITSPFGTGMDVSKTEDFLHNRFRYRGILKDGKKDESVFKDLTHDRLLGQYRSLAIVLGLYYQSIGEIEKAIKEFEFSELFQGDVKSGEPEEERAWIAVKLTLADLYNRKGEYEKGLLKAQDILKEAQAPEIYRVIGESYLGLKDLNKAEENFNKALSFRFADPFLIMDFLTLYNLKGDTQKLREIIKLTERMRNLPEPFKNKIDSLKKTLKNR
ncbi:MAG: DUF2723 domain-containing protein [candidate division WOR-3 bacterium]